ncbi:DUF4259 domain-containing protein [Spirillospora sp. NPDC052242]
MSTWGKGPFDEDTAMDFFDQLDTCSSKVRGERMKAAILRVSRESGHIGYVEATKAVVAASLLAGMMPHPEDEPWSATLPTTLLEDLAADAAVAIERAHSPGSDLYENWTEMGGYDQVWQKLAPVLRVLRAVGEPMQNRLFRQSGTTPRKREAPSRDVASANALLLVLTHPASRANATSVATGPADQAGSPMRSGLAQRFAPSRRPVRVGVWA